MGSEWLYSLIGYVDIGGITYPHMGSVTAC